MKFITLKAQDVGVIKQLSENTTILLRFYANWCGWCNAMKHQWNQLQESPLLKDIDGIIIDADISGINNLNHPIKEVMKGEGIPVVFYINNKEIVKYTGPRQTEPIAEFYIKNLYSSEPVNSIKAREQQAREQQAREQQAREQKAREQQAREQQAREQQAREQQAREQQAREQQAREQQHKPVSKENIQNRLRFNDNGNRDSLDLKEEHDYYNSLENQFDKQEIEKAYRLIKRYENFQDRLRKIKEIPHKYNNSVNESINSRPSNRTKKLSSINHSQHITKNSNTKTNTSTRYVKPTEGTCNVCLPDKSGSNIYNRLKYNQSVFGNMQHNTDIYTPKPKFKQYIKRNQFIDMRWGL